MSKPRILLIADVPGWVFEKHCREIKRRLKHKYDFTIGYFVSLSQHNLSSYDVVYLMDALTEEVEAFRNVRHKTVIGVRGDFYLPSDSFRFRKFYFDRILARASFMHTVNLKQYVRFSHCAGIPVMYVPHGVDTEVFVEKNPRRASFTVGMCGTLYSGGGKGFDVVREVCSKLKIRFIGATGRMSVDAMVRFYNQIDVYCCFSKFEGQNNPIMEAGSVGVPVISTGTGAAHDMIKHGVNGYLIKRRAAALIKYLVRLRSNPEKRLRMGVNLRDTIRNGWSWEVCIKGFDRMFKGVLEK